MTNKERYNKWYAKNRNKRLAYLRAYRARNPERYRKAWRNWRDENRTEYLKRKRAYDLDKRKAIKLEVLGHYSRGKAICACCGIDEIVFLSIDHINGNGNKHRKEIGRKSGNQFYAWLKAHKYPRGYQVLCYNCNIAKYQQ